MAELYTFDDKSAWAEALCEQISRQMIRALEKQGFANVILPGGTTPAPVFKRLASQPLTWQNVTFMPSDERWVEHEHAMSNYKLLKETLLVDKAATAQLVSLKTQHQQPEQALEQLNKQLPEKLQYNACTVLGMGPDGHIASLFPNLSNLKQGLALNNTDSCMAADATGSPVAGEYSQRLSLTLAALINSPLILVMVTGEAKLALLKQVLQGEHQELPIAHLMNQTKTPVEIYWTA